MPDPIRYQTTGALLPRSPLYVERAADDQLLEGLRAGDFCYVLSARQMGKSSLLSQTVARLREGGVRVATANLQAAGDVKTETEWYEGVIDQLVTTAAENQGFTLAFDWGKWWDEQRGPAGQRFVNFIRTAFLEPDDKQWVIAIDEIDATISLPFTDSFFAAIRLCYDNRPGQPVYRRLGFVLLGVATPTELIKDRSRTPFNIGKPVELTGFTVSEAQPLTEGLGGDAATRSHAIQCIIGWTGGQPHLTQQLCEKLASAWKAAAAAPTTAEVTHQVDDLVASTYLRGSVFKQPHFAYIAEQRIGRFPDKAGILRALARCREEQGCDPAKIADKVAELKISGLAITSADERLRISNRIYREVFNEGWINAQMPPNVGRNIGAAATALVSLLIAGWYFWLAPQAAIEASRDAEIFSAVRGIALGQTAIPQREHTLLERYTDDQIASSIIKGEARLAEVGLTPDQYQNLRKYAGDSHISQQLWQDYWFRQAAQLERLAARLSSPPGSAAGVPQTTETGAPQTTEKGQAAVDSEEIRDQLKALSATLQQGLSSEAEPIRSEIQRVAGKAMMKEVKYLWEPIDQSFSIKQSTAEAGRISKAAAALFAHWDAAEDILTALAPLVDDETCKDAFTRIVLGQAGERQKIQKADAMAQGGLQPALAAGQSRDDAPPVLFRRATAHELALSALARSSRPTAVKVLGDLLATVIEELSPQEAERLNTLPLILNELLVRLQGADASTLAARCLAVLIQTIEKPRQNNNKGEPEMSGTAATLDFGRAFDALVKHLQPKDAVLLGARLAQAMENALQKQTDDLPLLSGALNTLTERLAMTERLDANAAAPLAARGAEILIRAIENPRQQSVDKWFSLGSALDSLAKRLERKDAAFLAPRLAHVLEGEVQKNDSVADLFYYARALASLLGRLYAEDAAPVAVRGAAVLAQAMEKSHSENTVLLPNLAEVLNALVPLMGAQDASRMAARGAAALTREMEGRLKDTYGSLIDAGRKLSSLAAHLDAADASPLADRMILAMQAQPKDGGGLPEFGKALAALSARLQAGDAAPRLLQGAEILIQALESPQKDAGSLPDLGSALGELLAHMDAAAAAPLAMRGALVLEKELHQNEVESSSFAMSSALAALAAHLDDKDAARLATRLTEAAERTSQKSDGGSSSLGPALAALAPLLAAEDAAPLAARLAQTLEHAPQARRRELEELGIALAALAARLPFKDAAFLAARGARALIQTLEADLEQTTQGSLDFREVFGKLMPLLEAREAAPLAVRMAALITHAAEKNDSELTELFFVFNDLLLPLEPQEASPLVARVAPVITRSIHDFDTDGLAIILILWLNHPGAVTPDLWKLANAALDKQRAEAGINDYEMALLSLMLSCLNPPGTDPANPDGAVTRWISGAILDSTGDLPELRDAFERMLKPASFSAFVKVLVTSLQKHAAAHPGDQKVVAELIAHFTQPPSSLKPKT